MRKRATCKYEDCLRCQTIMLLRIDHRIWLLDQRETHCETSRLDDRRGVRHGGAWAFAVGLRPDPAGADRAGHARPREILRGVHLRSGRLQAVCRRTRWPVRHRTPTPGRSARRPSARCSEPAWARRSAVAVAPPSVRAVAPIAGTGIGMGSSSSEQYGIQQQYDNAFAQCMYSKGNMVPGYGPMMVNRRYSRQTKLARHGPAIMLAMSTAKLLRWSHQYRCSTRRKRIVK